MDHLAFSPSAFFLLSLFFPFLVVSPYLSKNPKTNNSTLCLDSDNPTHTQQSTRSTRLRATTATKRTRNSHPIIAGPFSSSYSATHVRATNRKSHFRPVPLLPQEQVDDSTGRIFLPFGRAYPSNCPVPFDILLSRGSSFGRFWG